MLMQIIKIINLSYREAARYSFTTARPRAVPLHGNRRTNGPLENHNFRHHAPRWRAVARLQHESDGEAAHGPAARSAWRRRDRGWIPGLLRWRFRIGKNDCAGDPPAQDRRTRAG